MSTIKLKIDTEQDLYNPYDADELILKDDIKSYIVDKIEKSDNSQRIEIQLISNEEISRDNVGRALNEWFKSEENDIKKAYRKNMIQQLWMFIVGFVFIGLSLMIDETSNAVLFTVLSTIGAFSMWEAASIFIIQNPKLRRRKFILKKLSHDIIINFVKL